VDVSGEVKDATEKMSDKIETPMVLTVKLLGGAESRGALTLYDECRERLVWFAPFQPLPHGEPQPNAGASSIGVCTEKLHPHRFAEGDRLTSAHDDVHTGSSR
jgi:hypothetical protein